MPVDELPVMTFTLLFSKVMTRGFIPLSNHIYSFDIKIFITQYSIYGNHWLYQHPLPTSIA